jgi:hypothetical protein
MSSLRRIPLGTPLAAGLACAILALAWQVLTVRYNYQGNWTALFCTGAQARVPPQLAGEGIYTFANSTGYDGQFYHYVAHDPLLQRGLDKYMDAPRLRYRRILVPGLARLAAFGQDRWVDPAFISVILLSVFLGAYWLGRCASLYGFHPAWGAGFLLVPATLISVDRLVVDATLAALTVGFVYYARRGPPWKLYAVLACAILARETGFLLLAGYCLYLLWRRLPARALLFGTAAVPALAWYAFVQTRTQGDVAPQYGFLRVLLTPKYDLPAPLAALATTLDYLVIAGILLAIVLAIRFALTQPSEPEAAAGLLFGLMTVWMLFWVELLDPYTYPRVLSPLAVLLALQGLRARAWIACVPAGALAARAALQMGNEALGILRGFFRS